VEKGDGQKLIKNFFCKIKHYLFLFSKLFFQFSREIQIGINVAQEIVALNSQSEKSS
jgi:hypothetical protein